MAIYVAVHQHDFSVADEYTQLRQHSHCGAVVTFVGLVRDLVHEPLISMSLEHYPGMTERALFAIIARAQQQWPIDSVRLIHRVGTLTPKEQIVFVGIASAHRAAAFAAAEYIMDFLKQQAPFWKKEQLAGSAYWVAAKTSDQLALKRWEQVK